MQNLDGLLPTGWARHRAHRRGRWGAGLGAGPLGWALGAGLGAGRWARGHAWARALQAVGRAGARRSGRVRACAGVSGRARARTRCACAGRQASGRAGARRARGRQCAAGRDRTRGRARQDARQGAAGRDSARPGRGLGVQLGQVGCFGAPDSVFGPVRLGSFLSHLMNTVHCKINLRKKKNIFLNLIKIK